MEKTKNFRIILHLTHFFQDHRCMCKIFINKKMKCIADLENHIQEIFSLENFYLLSNGHYIPPTEDIRILQQDDVVVAIPKLHTNLPAHTSTPLSKNTNVISLKTKGKRKREIIEECENEEAPITSNNMLEDKTRSKKKKKKNNKTDICKKLLGEEDIETENNCVDSPKIDKEHRTLKSGDISNSEKNYEANVQERDDVTKQQESGDQNISYPGFKISEENIQNESDNSVKQKISYFEKHSDLSDPRNKSGIIEDKIVEDKNTKQECHQENDEISANSPEEKEKNLDFRQKKLVIQKRNTELISYVLPKKSNIVKSIVVTNSLPDKEVNLTINIPIVSSDNNIAKELPQEKSMFTSNLKHNIRNTVNKDVDHFRNKLKEKPPSELICPQVEKKQIESTQRHLIIENKPLTNMQLSTATSNSQISHYENVTELPYASNKSTPVEKSFVAPEETSMTNITNSHENKQTLKGIENSFNNNLLLMENSTEYDQNDKADNSTNTSKDFPMDIDNISINSEKGSSLARSFSSEKQSDHIDYFETPSFITKRKRKRSHRKRKSKVSIESEYQLNAVAESYRPVQNITKRHPTPAIHIKFSDDEDFCVPNENANSAEKCIEEISLEKIQKNILPSTEEINKNLPIEEKQLLESIEITENGDVHTTPHVPKTINGTANVIAKTKEFNEAMNTEDVLEKTNKNQITICDDSIEEMTKAAACSTPLISEDIILKSPLMRSTKPKSRDIIAFKILRLAKDYTPQLSKHIIGQVRSFNEENLNLDVNVIDGVDQCREPDGKFSIEEPKIDCNTVKTYCWNDLVEPRLIFP